MRTFRGLSAEWSRGVYPRKPFPSLIGFHNSPERFPWGWAWYSMPWTPMLDVKLIRSISRSWFRSCFLYSEAGKGQRPPGRDVLRSSHPGPTLKHHHVLLPRDGSLLPFVVICTSPWVTDNVSNFCPHGFSFIITTRFLQHWPFPASNYEEKDIVP